MTTSPEPAYYTDKSGQQHEIPESAIRLRLDWLDADRAHSEACRALDAREAALKADPEAVSADDADRARLVDQMVEARGRLQDATNRMYEDDWRKSMDSWYAADQAMRAAAAARLERPEADVRDPATPPAAQPA